MTTPVNLRIIKATTCCAGLRSCYCGWAMESKNGKIVIRTKCTTLAGAFCAAAIEVIDTYQDHVKVAKEYGLARRFRDEMFPYEYQLRAALRFHNGGR